MLGMLRFLEAQGSATVETLNTGKFAYAYVEAIVVGVEQSKGPIIKQYVCIQ